MKYAATVALLFLFSAGTISAMETQMMDKNFGIGARGEHVSALQETLVAQGFLPATSPRGYFGPATKRAVMQYQKKHGLKQTGFVGPTTRAKWKMMRNEMKGDGMMKKDGMMDKKDTMMKGEMKKDAMMKAKGSYGTYAQEKLAWAKDGKVILFFHASWCPSCKTADTAIQSSPIPDGVYILKTDYDANTSLKQKYGVTYQHTFVQVDAAGNMITKWSGSSSVAEIVAKLQ